MHMVHYLYGQRNQGIMFRSNGNTEPMCYYDSSDKGDPSDQRASGGYVIMLAVLMAYVTSFEAPRPGVSELVWLGHHARTTG